MLRQILVNPNDPSLSLVQLTKGYQALIATVDADQVGDFNWCAIDFKHTDLVYAATKMHGKRMYLHRFVGQLMGLALSAEVDHIDGNGLNNARSNLRDANRSENVRNVGLLSTNTSGVKGVSWRGDIGKWDVRIELNGRRQQLGVYSDLTEAKQVIDDARAKLHGAFARAA